MSLNSSCTIVFTFGLILLKKVWIPLFLPAIGEIVPLLLFNCYFIECQSHPFRRTEGNKGIHTFHKGINPKVNATARLEFELAYYKVAVQYVSHNGMRLPALIKHI